jgi:hypothetical protein
MLDGFKPQKSKATSNAQGRVFLLLARRNDHGRPRLPPELRAKVEDAVPSIMPECHRVNLRADNNSRAAKLRAKVNDC